MHEDHEATKNIHGDKQLLKNLAALAHARSESLSFLAMLSQPELDSRPGVDKWSAGEVFDHVWLSEAFFRESISRLLEGNRRNGMRTLSISFAELNVRPAFVPSSLLPFFEIPLTVSAMFCPQQLVPRYFVRALLATPFGSAKHPDAADPRPGLSKSQLTHQLETGIVATETLIAENSDLAIKELSLSHPLLGKNSVDQMLEIMSMHELGHLRKLKDRLSPAMEVATPGAANLTMGDRV